MWGSFGSDGGKLRGFPCGFSSLYEVGGVSSPGRGVCCEVGDLRVGKFKIPPLGFGGLLLSGNQEWI